MVILIMPQIGNEEECVHTTNYQKMTMTTSELLNRYRNISQEIFTFECIVSLLDWDQQVYMPPRAAEFRAQQIECMSKLAHEKRTSDEYFETVSELLEQQHDLAEDDAINIAESFALLERSRKLSPTFVARKAKASATAYTAWIEARERGDFQAIVPFLQENIALSKEEAELLGYAECPYDALLENYERGSALSLIKPLLTRLGEGLKELIPQIQAKQGDPLPPTAGYPIETQETFNAHILQRIGYDFSTGRLDTTTHPFMTTLGPRDKRITTRYTEQDYLSSLLTGLHEAGHALYEMGLREDQVGTPLGTTESLSIHESQSRLWENIIGRSRAFSHFLHEAMKEHLPAEYGASSPENIWQRLNYVTPSLIRVESDEVTYSLHVVIRLLLEAEIFTEDLPVEELPTRWNELYRNYLGVEVPNERLGILQDVHWYGVGFGYFPTYALGNLYSAIMMERIREDIPSVDEGIARGEFSHILHWLNKNVHEHGMRYRGPALAESLSGEHLSEKPFLEYLRNKFQL